MREDDRSARERAQRESPLLRHETAAAVRLGLRRGGLDERLDERCLVVAVHAQVEHGLVDRDHRLGGGLDLNEAHGSRRRRVGGRIARSRVLASALGFARGRDRDEAAGADEARGRLLGECRAGLGST